MCILYFFTALRGVMMKLFLGGKGDTFLRVQRLRIAMGPKLVVLFPSQERSTHAMESSSSSSPSPSSSTAAVSRDTQRMPPPRPEGSQAQVLFPFASLPQTHTTHHRPPSSSGPMMTRTQHESESPYEDTSEWHDDCIMSLVMKKMR